MQSRGYDDRARSAESGWILIARSLVALWLKPQVLLLEAFAQRVKGIGILLSTFRLGPPSPAMHLHPLRVFHCRTFSTTAPRPLFLLPEILSTAHDLATTIHTTTSLPYHTLIPLSAVLLRLSVTTPLTISSRAAALRAQRLQPLLSAYQHPIARAAKLSTADPAAWERQTRSETRKLAREVRRRWRCQTWKIVIAPLVQLPVWLTASVTLRAMTGAPGAWWGFGGGEEFVEPTLSTEGALWFQDLLLEDPYLLLPMGFSVLLFANIEVCEFFFFFRFLHVGRICLLHLG